MKKEDNLVATLLAVYAIILTLCIAIFKLLEVDITLATNPLIWSATIFGPLAVLMTFNSWREQKSAEIISHYSDDVYKGFVEYFKILEEYSISWPKKGNELKITKVLEDHYEKIHSTLILYCDFLRIWKKMWKLKILLN